MAKHFLIRRATRTAAASAALLAPATYSLASTAETAFALPSHRITVKDPIHKKHLLERIQIDTDSKERVVLTRGDGEENFVLYQVGLPERQGTAKRLMAPCAWSKRIDPRCPRMAIGDLGTQRPDKEGPDEARFRKMSFDHRGGIFRKKNRCHL